MLTRRPRKSWTKDEDDALQAAIAAMPPDTPICWTKVAPLIPGRTAKDCRKRWTSGLNSTVARGCWSQEEDDLLLAAVQEFGTDWCRVAQAVKVSWRSNVEKDRLAQKLEISHFRSIRYVSPDRSEPGINARIDGQMY